MLNYHIRARNFLLHRHFKEETLLLYNLTNAKEPSYESRAIKADLKAIQERAKTRRASEATKGFQADAEELKHLKQGVIRCLR